MNIHTWLIILTACLLNILLFLAVQYEVFKKIKVHKLLFQSLTAFWDHLKLTSLEPPIDSRDFLQTSLKTNISKS